jgi:uncharacterized protein (UPF0332 family)
MPFDWVGFLKLAEELANRPDEASKRSAISRAYYSIFNAAFLRAQLTPQPYPRGTRTPTHQWCWKKYQNTAGNLSCKQLGITGDRLKKRRTWADYDGAANPRLDQDVSRVLAEARKFLADLDALPMNYPTS